MQTLLKHERISRHIRGLAHCGYRECGTAADAIDDLVEEIRVVRANHAQLLKDFDARNEVIDGLELKLQEAATRVTQLETLVEQYEGMIDDANDFD